jgi:hypothetical protein
MRCISVKIVSCYLILHVIVAKIVISLYRYQFNVCYHAKQENHVFEFL